MSKKYRHYMRCDTQTGCMEKLPFADVDGARFGAESLDGYTLEVAALIVNRWNCISAYAPKSRFLYCVAEFEGAY